MGEPHLYGDCLAELNMSIVRSTPPRRVYAPINTQSLQGDKMPNNAETRILHSPPLFDQGEAN